MQQSAQADLPALYFNAHVSQFEGISPYPIATQPTVLDVFNYIRGVELKDKIAYLRKLHETEYDRYKKEKTTLLGVTFSGTFSHRSNARLIHHSGFVSIDIDHLETQDRTQELKELLSEDRYIAGLFISPSGIGLKALVKIHPVKNDAEHKAQFQHIKHYLNTEYDLQIDSLPDISRLCFMSYDPDAYSNVDSQIFDLTYDTKKTQDDPSNEQSQLSSSDVSLNAAIQVLLQKGIGIELGRNEYVGACGAFKRAGIEYAIFDKIMQKTPGYDTQENLKIWNTVKEEEQVNGTTERSVIWYARETDKRLFLDTRKALLSSESEEEQTEIGLATAIKNKLLTRYAFRLNIVTDKIMCTCNEKEALMSDYRESEIRCWLLNHGFTRRDAISDVIKALAWHKQYHPIQDFLQGLTWDTQDRFEELGEYIKDTDNIFVSVFASFLVGAVRKVFTGKHHPMIVLAGPQQIGKSFFAEWLCPLPKYFLSAPISPDANDTKIRATERLIWEVGELGSTTRRQDVEALKWFITLESIVFRRAHDKYDVEKPALASFIGTVNEDGVGFLNDTTGYSRWRPVRITYIDHDYTKYIDSQQLWAQAYQMYKEDPEHSHNLVNGIQEIIDARIEDWYAQRDPMEELLFDLFEFTGSELDTLGTIEILKVMELAGYRGKGSRADAMFLSRVLNKPFFIKHGVEKGRSGSRGYKGIRVK